jgi:hypothetical protein
LVLIRVDRPGSPEQRALANLETVAGAHDHDGGQALAFGGG